MAHRKKTLPVKDLHTPRFFIWLRGFVHGRILRTGGLDPEDSVISSGYVTAVTERYYGACAARCEQAESKLRKIWSESNRLLIELKSVPTRNSSGSSNRETHAQQRADEKSAALRRQLLTSLSDNANAIRTEYNIAKEQMCATAKGLCSVLSTYGHGLLKKPVCAANLPTFAENGADPILTGHEDIWNTMTYVLEEAV